MIAAGPWLVLTVLAVLSIPLQSYLLPAFLPTAWVPDLGVLAVIWCGLRYGEGIGVVAGLLLGLLFDRFTAGAVGQHIFVLPCVAAGAALTWRLASQKTLAARLVVLVVFAVLAEVAGAVLFDLADAILLDGWSVAFRLVPGILSDVLFGAALFTLSELAPVRYQVP